MRAFKFKVEQYLKKYRRSLSYHQEKIWRDKIVITEKAICRSKKELENKFQAPAKEEDEMNPAVEEMIDAAQADEVPTEKLLEPPAEEMANLKRSMNRGSIKKGSRRKKKFQIKITESESKIVHNGTKEVC